MVCCTTRKCALDLFTPYCWINSCVVSNKKGFCCIQFGKFQLIQRLNFISSFPFSDVTTEAATDDITEMPHKPAGIIRNKGEHLMLTLI